MKILIIDDERFIRNSLKEILGDEGYDVDTAEDGKTALEMVSSGRYDVIFCDISIGISRKINVSAFDNACNCISSCNL